MMTPNTRQHTALLLIIALILSGCAHTTMTIRTQHSIGDAITYWQIGGYRPGTVEAIITTARYELGQIVTTESYLIRDGATEQEIEIDGRYVSKDLRTSDTTDFMITRDK